MLLRPSSGHRGSGVAVGKAVGTAVGTGVGVGGTGVGVGGTGVGVGGTGVAVARGAGVGQPADGSRRPGGQSFIGSGSGVGVHIG